MFADRSDRYYGQSLAPRLNHRIIESAGQSSRLLLPTWSVYNDRAPTFGPCHFAALRTFSSAALYSQHLTPHPCRQGRSGAKARVSVGRGALVLRRSGGVVE